jgi:hypothetical protein
MKKNPYYPYVLEKGIGLYCEDCGNELRQGAHKPTCKHFLQVAEPPHITISDPVKPWSPCPGAGCEHPSHKKSDGGKGEKDG